MMKRFVNFLRYPFNKKLAILLNRTNFIFLFKALYLKRFAISYLPDSFVRGNYSYYTELYEKFRMENRLNNGGDVHRLNSFILNIEYLMSDQCIEGDFAELGVWRGNTAQILAHYAKKYNRRCYLFDTFEGFDNRDVKGIDAQFEPGHFSNTSIKLVKSVIGDEHSQYCEFISGYFPKSIPKNFSEKRFSVVSLDADLYEPMKAGLEHFFPLMTNGGLFLLHDYSSGYWTGCKKAIDEFCDKEIQQIILMPDKSGSAFIRISKGPITG